MCVHTYVYVCIYIYTGIHLGMYATYLGATVIMSKLMVQNTLCGKGLQQAGVWLLIGFV